MTHLQAPHSPSMPSGNPAGHLLHERVRWADVDLVGIMRFSAFPRLVELGEQELMRAAGLPFASAFDAPAHWLPRRALSIDYVAPARIDDLLAVRSWISRIGATSMTYTMEIRIAESRQQPSGTLVAVATMVVVCVAAATFEKCALPDQLREAVAPFCLPMAPRPAAAG